MDPYFIGFLILIVIIGAVIAVIADRVGKKLGKKRLTIGGLRPRTTAAIGTALVGILISAFTIAFVLAISAPIRQSLLQGNKIRVELNTDREELKTLEREMRDRSGQNAALTNVLGILKTNMNVTDAELKKRQTELKVAQQTLSELKARIESLQARIGGLMTTVSAKQAALNQSEQRLQTAGQKLTRIQAKLNYNQIKLAQVENYNHDIDLKNAELYTKNDDLQKTQAALQKDLAQIKQDVDTLQKAKQVAQDDLRHSQADLDDVRRQLDTERRELAGTKAELSAAKQDFSAAYFVAREARTKTLIYQIGEEVVRATVPAGRSVNAAQAALTNLIRRAAAEAQRRGAKPRANYGAAGIFDHDDRVTGAVIPAEMIERQIVRQIAGAPSRAVLIASATVNTFMGEPVSLEVTVLPDPLVYTDGQTVAETVIDGNRGDLTIYDELRKFLQETVKTRAQKDGMIPIAKGDAPLGSVSQADLLAVIQELHNAARRIRLQAHVTGDTYASDPLKLEFRLR